MRKIKIIIIVAFVLLLSFSPIIISLVAGYIANTNNCILHEGFKNPCIINGHDYGETLYRMGVTGWLVFFTVPMGIFLLVISPFILKLIRYIKAKYASA